MVVGRGWKNIGLLLYGYGDAQAHISLYGSTLGGWLSIVYIHTAVVIEEEWRYAIPVYGIIHVTGGWVGCFPTRKKERVNCYLLEVGAGQWLAICPHRPEFGGNTRSHLLCDTIIALYS